MRSWMRAQRSILRAQRALWHSELRADERSEEVLSDHPKGRMARIRSPEGTCGAPKARSIDASALSMDASAASIVAPRAQGRRAQRGGPERSPEGADGMYSITRRAMRSAEGAA